MRRAWAAAVVPAIVACAGCTQDFDAFMPQQAAASVPIDAAGLDGGAVDVASEAGCPPGVGDACFADARACGGACASARTDCERDCSTGACRKKCRDDEAACAAACAGACTSCTESAGCASPSRCAAEAD